MTHWINWMALRSVHTYFEGSTSLPEHRSVKIIGYATVQIEPHAYKRVTRLVERAARALTSVSRETRSFKGHRKALTRARGGTRHP